MARNAPVGRLACIALAALAVWAPDAAAETFCVPAHVGCSGTAHATVQAGLNAAAGNNNADVDRVQIAASASPYVGSPNFVYLDSEPLDIVGAGVGQTILTGPTQAGAFIVLGTGTGTNVSVSDLTVDIPGGNTINQGIRAGGTVQRVSITSQPGATAGVGIDFQSSAGILRDSTITLPPGTTVGMRFFGASRAATVEDVAITANTGIRVNVTQTATVHRAEIASGGTGLSVSGGGAATIDDSLVRVQGTTSAADAVSATPGTDAATTTSVSADHLTIVGESGTPDGLDLFSSGGTNGSISVTLTSSIMRGIAQSWRRGGTGAGNQDLTITHSNYDASTAVPGASVPGTVTQTPGNINTDPLFAGASDFRLTAGSPSIDTGTTPFGGSPTDLDGAARTQDGNGDGNAVSDMGAFEFPTSAPPGGGGPPTGGPTPPTTTGTTPLDRIRPLAALLRSSRFAFRAAGRGASIGRLQPIATTITYRLSETARMRFTVHRERAGRLVNRVCRVPSRANRLRPRCRRYVPVAGSFTHAGRAGANAFRFTGRLAGRKLAPGLHRLTGVPTDAAGNRGVARTLRFRIVP